MSISVKCGHCFSPFQVAEKYAGKTLRCKTCGEAMRVPLDSRSDLPDEEPLPLYDYGTSRRGRRGKSGGARKTSAQPIGLAGWLPLMIIAGVFVLFFPVALMVPKFGKVYILLAAFTGMGIYFWGQISLLIVAFKVGAPMGLLCLFLTPFYVIYMLISDWRKIARPLLRLVAAVALFFVSLSVQFIVFPPGGQVAQRPRAQQRQAPRFQQQPPREERQAPRIVHNTPRERSEDQSLNPRKERQPVVVPPATASKPRRDLSAGAQPDYSKTVRTKTRQQGNDSPPPGTIALEPEAELTPGMRVVAQRIGTRWEAAEIVGVEQTDQIHVHYLRLPESFDRVVARDQVRVQLPADQIDEDLVREVVFEILHVFQDAPLDVAVIENEFLTQQGYLPGSLKIDLNAQRITLKVIRNSRADKHTVFPLVKAKLAVREIK
ncbi:hypothetical protein Pan258_28610 [Symmachiella dynata]|uniref:glycosyltransferase family 39 protein n=1 Tax=Symmachiella dynata TaxID=2527995 RepID=UPI00118CF478|nr:glycosyltransferase family 39 protein [Symmachiella dynata]QDT48815.1 hypothetical protein Pan258_28610 [Symmachiella dynata]